MKHLPPAVEPSGRVSIAALTGSPAKRMRRPGIARGRSDRGGWASRRFWAKVRRLISLAFFTIGILLSPVLRSPGAESLTGLLDQTFNAEITPDGQASIVLQPDGKIVTFGALHSASGLNPSGLVRLNTDGSLDRGFHAGGVPQSIHALVLQPEGRLLVGGTFTNYNGTEANGAVRLNPDGTIDPSFSIGAGPTFPATGYAPIFALALQADGKIVLGGDFEAVAGVKAGGVARLLANGSVDPNFSLAGQLRWVYALAVQADGKILVGCVYGILRFNGDGSLDEVFQKSYRPVGGVANLAVLPDGRILAASDNAFRTAVGISSLIRLFPDGSVDGTFEAIVSGRSYCLALDGKQQVLANDDVLGLVRLNPDGARDWSLDLVSGLEAPLIQSAAVQPDGKILVAGQFSQVDGVARASIARLMETNLTSTIFLANSNFHASEADTNLSVLLVRHGNAQNRAAVSYHTEDETATNGVDYLAAIGTLEFAPGERARTLPISVLDDHQPGPSYKTFAVVLTQPTGDATLGSPSRAVVSLKEADPVFALELVGTNYAVSQFGPDISLYVQRVDPLGFSFSADLMVDYRTGDGSAQAGKDYGAVSGTLTFLGWEIDRPGPAYLPVSIPVYDNATVDGRKNFSLTISNPRFLKPTRGQVILGPNTNATITIIDSDVTAGSGQGADGSVGLAAAQSDGRILIVGSFNTVNGVTRHRIARLNSDLSLDPTFDAGSATSLPIEPMGLIALPEGKALVWGVFGQVITRLSADGSVDRSFYLGSVMPVTDNPAAIVSALDLTNGQYLVAGDFVGFNNIYRGGLARLDRGGGLDPSFDFHLPGILEFRGRQLCKQPDGKILLGGLAVGGDLGERAYLGRLMPNGSLDLTFSTPSRDALICGVFPDGKVLLSDRAQTGNLTLLRSDGSLDSGFNPNFATRWFSALIVQPDEQVFFAGNDPLGGWSPVLGRFDESGRLDTSFRTSTSGYVSALVPLPNQRTFVAGSFTAIDAAPHYRFAVLETDGHVADAFRLNLPVLDPSGNAHLSSSQVSFQTMVVQVSTNLTDWTPIFTNEPLVKLQFLDPDGLTSSLRFYRASPIP